MNLRLISPLLLALCTLFIAGCDPLLLSMATSRQNLSCCGLIILILDIIAIVEIVGSSRETGSKLIWVLFIIFAPFLGFIIYYIFANRS